MDLKRRSSSECKRSLSVVTEKTVENKMSEKVQQAPQINIEFDNLRGHSAVSLKDTISIKKADEEEFKNARDSITVKKRDSCEEVQFSDFDLKYVIGRGAFGKVFLASLKNTEKLYAIKAIRKDTLLKQGHVETA